MDSGRLKFAREKAGHTQESLAEVLEISPRMISRYENGNSEPTADVITGLSQSLNVSADYLLGLTDDPTPADQNKAMTKQEQKILAALRRGDRLEAIRTIAETS